MYGPLDSTRDKGEIVIQKLKDLCLLETGTLGGGFVKMHDLVREVALEHAKSEPNRFVVHAIDSPYHFNIVADEWENATRVSMMSCEIPEGSLPEMPRCPKMSTLLMPDVVVKRSRDLPDGFFTYMRKLVVLDLSSLLAHTVPTSICLLSELRFLSLGWAGIRSLPKELGNLVNLRQLDLSWTLQLEEIPQQAILGLSNLQVLNMMWCGYKWGLDGDSSDDDADNNGDMQLSVSDLDGMTQLQDSRISVYRLDCLYSLFNRIDSVLTSITELAIGGIGGLTTNTLQSALRRMTNLRWLSIYSCEELTGKLILDGNAHKPMLSELEELTLGNVPLSAITITRDGMNHMQWGGPLQKLRSLELDHLPNLQRICDDPPQNCLPSLEDLEVFHCPLLRTLPLGPHSKIKEIRCRKEWWEGLQWGRDQRDARRTAELALRFDDS